MKSMRNANETHNIKDMPRRHGIGLVFSGGGMKGAYQAGVVKVLAEMGVEADAVSGASIGALNGAVTASSGSLRNAAPRMEKLWRAIADDPPLGDKVPLSMKLLEAMGLRFAPGTRNTAKLAREVAYNFIPTMLSPKKKAFVDNGGIRRMLDEYVTDEQLEAGLPLYVSVFPNHRFIESIIRVNLAILRIKDSPDSEFLHVQSPSNADRKRPCSPPPPYRSCCRSRKSAASVISTAASAAC